MFDESAKVRLLENENDLLRERIRQLETELGFVAPIPPIFGLTTQETRLLSALLSRDLCTKEYLMLSLYGLRHDGDVPEIKIVDVFVCKVRKKLKPFGVFITTIWGQGWSLPSEAKNTLQSIMSRARSVA